VYIRTKKFASSDVLRAFIIAVWLSIGSLATLIDKELDASSV
jgi:hypothetical protein